MSAKDLSFHCFFSPLEVDADLPWVCLQDLVAVCSSLTKLFGCCHQGFLLLQPEGRDKTTQGKVELMLDQCLSCAGLEIPKFLCIDEPAPAFKFTARMAVCLFSFPQCFTLEI